MTISIQLFQCSSVQCRLFIIPIPYAGYGWGNYVGFAISRNNCTINWKGYTQSVWINVKLWRLLNHWYTNATARVRIDACISNCFPISCGVKQGSVLSLTLFLIVMDRLIHLLRESNHRASVSDVHIWVQPYIQTGTSATWCFKLTKALLHNVFLVAAKFTVSGIKFICTCC